MHRVYFAIVENIMNLRNTTRKIFSLLEEQQGMMISCLEEIAFRRGYIDQSQLMELAEKYKNNSYGEYLNRLANGKI
jgi:dTDP-glucose pyrophosphorylase